MNVDNFIWKCLHQTGRHKPHETGQHNQVYLLIQEQICYTVCIIKRGSVEQQDWYVPLPATVNNARFGVVRQHQRHLHVGVISKIVSDFIGVGAGAGSKQSDAFQKVIS